MTLETMLEERGISYKKTFHRETYTSQALAAEEHVSGYNVAKPVIVKCDRGYVMCVVPACAKVDLDWVAEVLQQFDVRLATEDEMMDLFPECELGAEPPIGKLFGMTTVMDTRLHEDDYLIMQSGKHTEAIRIGRLDWERVCEPIIADIARTAAP